MAKSERSVEKREKTDKIAGKHRGKESDTSIISRVITTYTMADFNLMSQTKKKKADPDEVRQVLGNERRYSEVQNHLLQKFLKNNNLMLTFFGLG